MARLRAPLETLDSRLMAEPAQKPWPEEAPLADTYAVEREYRRRRAKRRALEQRARERRRANIRFWVFVAVVAGLSVYLGLLFWHEIQRLFGL
jgi:hypothetical protein